MNARVLLLILGAISIAGCGMQQPSLNGPFMVNQISGKYRTGYNGDLQRTRSYDGVRQYGDDNVAIIVTDANGRSQTRYTKYPINSTGK